MCKTASLIIIAFMIAASIMVFQPVKADVNVITVPDDFPTINQAIQNASDGDTIFIKQGTYNETIIIDKAVTLRGEDTNRTIINGNTTATVIQILHDNVTITGLTITYSLTPNTPRRYYQHDFPQDIWKEQVYSIDNYPLMQPFDTTCMFTVHKKENFAGEQSTPNPTDYTAIEIAASVTGVIAIAALIVYFKKQRDPF
ncbi:MAG TPA: hypothetical protein VLH35_06790 [Candidatus Acidoferrales bacterium]|nr:hypothetical protein [Candidatus Acidoferrales bacterium]